ncbi:MAG TPA: hypothetical protein PK595_03955 [Bacteroidota bacterium]|nr:hypothetical protein [Bacteroidota bacterium]
MFNNIHNWFEKILLKLFNRIDKPAIENRILLGQILSQRVKQIDKPISLADVEFKIFSQHREDGIIQYLISHIPIENKTFIEFGVEDYRESNTRFLLMNNLWKGLIFDSEKKYISRIRTSNFYWKFDLTAEQAFITKDNVNELFEKFGFKGDIGLLSIDIDGNDYWVWEAITVIQPRIVICEYNSVFGKDYAVTIPYNPNFNRTKAHYSNLYFGASMKALCFLAEKKGYYFIGADSSGTNAFFVRKDVAQNVPHTTCDDGFIEKIAREARDSKGALTFISGEACKKIIENMIVLEITSGKEICIRDLTKS